MKTSSIIHLKADQTGPAIETIIRQTGLSQNFLHDLADLGAIYINHQRVLEPKLLLSSVNAGEYLRIHPNPKRFSVETFDAQKSILFEDDHLLSINKPSGLPVHPTLDNKIENLLHLTQTQTKKKLFITHRLDVGTSGIVLLAKSIEAQKKINIYFSEGRIRKIYRAWIHGKYNGPKELTHYMQPSERAPKVVSLHPIYGWQHCKLSVLDAFETDAYHSELTIELHTGRTHQIRAQLSSMGHPIVGDVLYGSHTQVKSSGDHWALQCSYLEIPSLQDFDRRSHSREQESDWAEHSPISIKVTRADWQ